MRRSYSKRLFEKGYSHWGFLPFMRSVFKMHFLCLGVKTMDRLFERLPRVGIWVQKRIPLDYSAEGAGDPGQDPESHGRTTLDSVQDIVFAEETTRCGMVA